MTPHELSALSETTYHACGIKERGDLQRLLKANISVIDENILVIDEEFSQWEDSKRRIDLLGIDRNANLVVIELKRDQHGGHMELQALRYAAMVSTMTFDDAVKIYRIYLEKENEHAHQVPRLDARTKILEFLSWDEPHKEDFARDVRIVLVSADFSKELTTAILWLNEKGLDIRCVRLKPYKHGNDLLVDVRQIIPLPETADYQNKLKYKIYEQRVVSQRSKVDTGYWFMNTGDGSGIGRTWEDCKKYGFMLAGGGENWVHAIKKLQPGDKLFAYLSSYGYVGFGEVTAQAVPFNSFIPVGHELPLTKLKLTAKQIDRNNDLQTCDYCVAVRWIAVVDRDKAVLKERSHTGTLHKIRQQDLVDNLLQHFDPTAHAKIPSNL